MANFATHPRALLCAFILSCCMFQATAQQVLCTNSADCNGRSTVAPTFNSALGRCVCTCRNSWNGTQCQDCPAEYDDTNDCYGCNTGYVGTYPTCTSDECNPLLDCNNNADYVTGFRSTGCTCHCINQWTGIACQTCAPQYDRHQACGACSALSGGDYPACSLLCTNASNCNGRAKAVSGTLLSGCTCTCSNSWSLSNCSACPAEVDAANNCASCVAGYTNYPNCELACSISTDCSNNADSVTGTQAGGCTCHCSNRWTGETCSECPEGYDPTARCGQCATGYSGYPNCGRTCTIATDCSNHAVGVSGNTVMGCQCSCRAKWSNTSCNVCPKGFNVTDDCNSCALGYNGFPSCTRSCTQADDCSGSHSLGASGNVFAGCQCTCANMWTGSDCSVCPYPFSGASCDTCSAGFIPDSTNSSQCLRSCTAADCNFHVTSVSGTATGECICTCRNNWVGTTCNFCPANFSSLSAAPRDCYYCNTTFYTANAATPPRCALKCTTQANCSGHATSVTGSDFNQCVCVCRNSWSGPTCSQCPASFDASQDCAACRPGYVGYPTCVRVCTINDDCNGHAGAVSGTTGNCTCSCTDPWIGATCSICPSNYAGSMCSMCNVGYDAYPSCFPKCTNANCSNNAATVTGNWVRGCNCTCAYQWTGTICDTCPTSYNPSGCKSCNKGFGGFPNCVRGCTNKLDCYGLATIVTGLVGACTCTCPSNFLVGTNCSTCAAGYDTWPSCYRTCTSEADCNNKAETVSGNVNTGCTCVCSANYTGTHCERCTVGYSGFPNCQRLCTLSDCSAGAESSTGYAPFCTCGCNNSWTGPRCTQCPPNYDPALDCAVCAFGFAGAYPQCERLCTNSFDCNGHAVQVSGVFGSCRCTCNNSWTGVACDVCLVRYDRLSDCAACAAGYTGNYPACDPTCTVPNNCSTRASNVTDDPLLGCLCECRNSWLHPNCAVCPQYINASNDCATCIDGYEQYPNCVRTCNVVSDCSGHATAVSGTAGACRCTCANRWTGTDCSRCAAHYNATQNCAVCASGYDTYPSCYLTCTLTANCSGNHSTSVTGNIHTGCLCVCANSWTGSTCATCPSRFDVTNCSTCAVGFANYPTCGRICSLGMDCGGRAIAVSGVFPNCDCTCANHWTIDSNCTVCPPRFNESTDCSRCASGFTGPSCFPVCRVDRDCSRHATAVSGNIVDGCHCTCRNRWRNATCNVCPSQFDSQQDCSACARGYGGYPHCRTVTMTATLFITLPHLFGGENGDATLSQSLVSLLSGPTTGFVTIAGGAWATAAGVGLLRSFAAMTGNMSSPLTLGIPSCNHECRVLNVDVSALVAEVLGCNASHLALSFALNLGGRARIQGDQVGAIILAPACLLHRPSNGQNISIPVQIVDDTPKVPVTIPQSVVQNTKSAVAATTIASAALGNPALASQGARMAMILAVAFCDPSYDAPQPADSPTQMLIGDPDDDTSPMVGAALGNMIIWFALCVAQISVASLWWFYRSRTRRPKAWIQCVADTRCPGMLIVPVLMLMQFTMTGVVVALGYASSGSGAPIVVGLLGLVVEAAIPASVAYLLLKRFHMVFRLHEAEGAHGSDDDGGSFINGSKVTPDTTKPLSPAQLWKRFLFGTGKWVSSKEMKAKKIPYVRYFGFFVTDYNHASRYFILVEMMVNIALGALNGIRPGDQATCDSISVGSTIVFAVYAFLIAYCRPYHAKFNYVVFMPCAVTQAVGSFFVMLYMLTSNSYNWMLSIGSILPTVVTYVMIAKTVVDTVLLVVDGLGRVNRHMRRTTFAFSRFLGVLEDEEALHRTDDLEMPNIPIRDEGAKEASARPGAEAAFQTTVVALANEFALTELRNDDINDESSRAPQPSLLGDSLCEPVVGHVDQSVALNRAVEIDDETDLPGNDVVRQEAAHVRGANYVDNAPDGATRSMKSFAGHADDLANPLFRDELGRANVNRYEQGGSTDRQREEPTPSLLARPQMTFEGFDLL